jgi:hypothetical protein
MNVSSCKDDSDGGSPAEANGQVEMDGKKYPLHECSVMNTSKNTLLSFNDTNGRNSLLLTMQRTSENELVEMVYTEPSIISGVFSSEINKTSNINGVFSEMRLEVTKSGSNYEFNFAAIATDLHDFYKHSYKMTYKGTVIIGLQKAE